MTERAHHKLIIIGSGPAGLTAAIYAARAELSPFLIAGFSWGGQLMLTSDIENFPGFSKGITGPELMAEMRAQAERFGTTVVDADATSVDFSKRPFMVSTRDMTYGAECVIMATGASALWLGLPSEQRLRGKGVSACATCDGFFFKGKDVAVVGGGDAAMEEATFLTKFAASVTVLVRKQAVRASRYMLERAEKDPKISFRYETVVTDVVGDSSVMGVRIRNTAKGTEEVLPVRGVFIAIGHKPDTGIVNGQLALDTQGYIVVKNLTATSVPGVFACGDVQDHRYRQAVSAAGSGCMAAMDAEKFLHSK